MSYTSFPPGRERMLAYASEINRHRHNNNNNNNRISSRLNDTIIFGTISTNTNRFNNFEISSFYDYEFLSELSNVKVGLISKNLLNKSKIKKSESLSFCTICQQDIFFDIIRTLDCSHCFHINCIDTWFIENNKCPQCRFEI